MAFELDLQQDFGKQVRKVALRQLEKSLKDLRRRSHQREWQDKAVHSFRKRVKKVRALMRLVREGLGEKTFARENKALRNATRPVSALRDAAALIVTLKLLQKRYRKPTWDRVFKLTQARLRAKRAQILQSISKEGAFRKASLRLNEIHAQVNGWKLRYQTTKVLHAGLCETYKQSRKAMRDARKTASDEHLHECRKRAKDLQYQLQLLRPHQSVSMKAIGAKAHQLTDLLGKDHDLAVLYRDAGDRIRPLIVRRRGKLQASAQALGESLFNGSPKQFSKIIREALSR